MATTPITPLEQQAWSKMFVYDVTIDGTFTVDGEIVGGVGESGEITLDVYPVGDPAQQITVTGHYSSEDLFNPFSNKSLSIDPFNIGPTTGMGQILIGGPGLSPLPPYFSPGSGVVANSRYIRLNISGTWESCVMVYNPGTGLAEISFRNRYPDGIPISATGIQCPGLSWFW